MRHILTALLCLFTLGSAFAQESDPLEVTVMWDPPTQRLDGMPMDPAVDIARYTLYCSTQPEVPMEHGYEIPGITSDGVHVATITDVFRDGYGQYYCVLTAWSHPHPDLDVESQQSPPSNVAQFAWLPADPGSPTQLLIIRVQ